ncbi:hypothetical protein J2S19_001639 [Metabacillus malikii]|uniref:Uncharacterized protein n=2 Tax=Metabacillus malikii TaxID=1504265 RepID=A0ABT9ZED7_9BACI|nr:hypothetical protein [Metabacillus malikii]
MKKIWTDADFFEVSLSIQGNDCLTKMNLYLDNHQLEILCSGIEEITNQLGQEFTWTSGSAVATSTHYIALRFYLHDVRGIIGIEVILNNNEEPPYAIRSTFYLLAEINQLDDLSRKLQSFIRGDIDEIHSLR